MACVTKRASIIGRKEAMRKHYCGLTKRYLQCVELNKLPECAELRSSCKDLGIALAKHEAAPTSIDGTAHHEN